MQKVNGKACFRELGHMNPDVKVVLSSDYNEQEAISQFAGQGLAGFIRKPNDESNSIGNVGQYKHEV